MIDGGRCTGSYTYTKELMVLQLTPVIAGVNTGVTMILLAIEIPIMTTRPRSTDVVSTLASSTVEVPLELLSYSVSTMLVLSKIGTCSETT